ncbi:MAG TPA: hypothetical protein VFW96_10225, partial [Thermomicrobiales bacterium]|nr:hypothetical protein [Thermomicrobiales bacterium]
PASTGRRTASPLPRPSAVARRAVLTAARAGAGVVNYSDIICPGETWARTLTTPGRCDSFRRYHEAVGMLAASAVRA